MSNLVKRNHLCYQASFSNALPEKARRLSPSTSDHEEINKYIPEDLLEEILLRLPAESLIMCKRVCKLWFNLINDPIFVNKHLVRVTNEHRKMLSSYSRTFFLKWVRQELSLEYIFDPNRSVRNYANDISKHELSLVTICDIDDSNSDNLHCVIEQVNLPPFPVTDGVPFPNNLRAFHCNGIIHMFDESKSEVAILLNPILREFKLLMTPYPPLGCSRNDDYNFVGSGFGYDPKSNVYKYVKIYCRHVYMKPIALVYTMGTHSYWRIIKIDHGEGNRCFPHPKGVYCKGVYYWWNFNNEMNQTILYFDMSEEKFCSIPIPDQLCRRVSGKPRQLEVWKESVCLFFNLESYWFSTIFEVWVMVDNFGTNWTKQLTIGPLVCINLPLAFWKDDELLMEGKDGRIVSYNIHTKKLRKVALPKAVFPSLSSANLCLNSLVSV